MNPTTTQWLIYCRDISAQCPQVTVGRAGGAVYEVYVWDGARPSRMLSQKSAECHLIGTFPAAWPTNDLKREDLQDLMSEQTGDAVSHFPYTETFEDSTLVKDLSVSWQPSTVFDLEQWEAELAKLIAWMSTAPWISSHTVAEHAAMNHHKRAKKEARARAPKGKDPRALG